MVFNLNKAGDWNSSSIPLSPISRAYNPIEINKISSQTIGYLLISHKCKYDLKKQRRLDEPFLHKIPLSVQLNFLHIFTKQKGAIRTTDNMRHNTIDVLQTSLN